jgi:transcriptional regulator with XRE-family HTH domain
MLSVDNFGEWLTKTLEQKGMSQSDLAQSAGLARGTLSNIISGTRGRGIDTMLAISKALKLHPKVVFRAAGILPADPEFDDEIFEMMDEIEKLNENDRREVLAFIRMKNNLRKKK